MRGRLNRFIRLSLGVSHREANGVIVLSVIVLLIIILHLFRQYQKPQAMSQADIEMLDSLVNVLETDLSASVKFDSQDNVVAEKDSFNYFDFDPNTASKSQFLSIGLSEELSNRIVKYRDSGGQFFLREDLRKIYGLTDSEYDRLSGYIKIPDKVVENSGNDGSKIAVTTFRESREEPDLQLDINSIDSTSLLVLKGIGPILSSRIVRFRSALGGFVRLEQLSEVYGINDSTYADIKKHIHIKSDFRPALIRINELSLDSLVLHPYIDFNRARVIAAYRDQHGSYNSIDDLRPIQILDSTWISKIEAYLGFQ